MLHEYKANHTKWKTIFAQKKKVLENILGDQIIMIEHIGSTNIPNLVAKNVIDIMVVVNDISIIKQYSESIQKSGYKAPREFFPLCIMFDKKTAEYDVHMHICDQHNNFYKQKLCFRDYMQKHYEIAAQYAQLKLKLVQEHSYQIKDKNGIRAYTYEKNDFIKSVLQQAEFNELMINFCMHKE